MDHQQELSHLTLASLPFFILLLCLPSLSVGDLNSDKQALLALFSAVPHGRKLNWNQSIPLCTSWFGITCTANSTRVIAVRLPGVGLHGPIPANTLGKLYALQVLSLRSNCLSGSIPSDVLSLPSLHYLYLQHNNFSGNVPPSLPLNLNTLDLSYNTFTGEIPRGIRNLTQLTSLSLQNNSLMGHIPDLNLPRLKHLNVSYNHLNDTIPLSLQKFSKSSFLGNSLCGFPLGSCPTYPISQKPHNGWKKSIIAIVVGGSALLFLLAIALLVCCRKRRASELSGSLRVKASSGGRTVKPKEEFSSGAQEAEKNKLVFFEGCSYNFDLEDLLRASAEVLGKGSYGTAYKAALEEGVTVVVKRLKEVIVGKREFEQQMDSVGRVGQHPNIVPLRAYYYSKDEKLLVYDYIETGSLASILHGNRTTGRTPLDWNTRLKILLGTARGLAYIHSKLHAKFCHGNIKSSNILLSEDYEPSVSDIGLAPVMNFPTNPPRTIGYRAPEVIEARKFTQKSDVYSFGVLLLEMLTGKAPLRSPGNGEDVMDLPRWVRSVLREEWTAEVFDVELMRHHQNVEEEMVQVLQVGMACVAKSADSRPKMVEVVRMIEEVGLSEMENRPSEEENGLMESNAETP